MSRDAYRPASADAVDALAREVAGFRRDLRASRKPRLTRAAIDDGALVATTGGVVSTIVGQQYDGTSGAFTVAGPTPPQPSGVSAETVTSGVRVRWTGSFTDPQPAHTSPVVAPMDWQTLEVQVSDSVDFPADGTREAAVTSPGGGYAFVPWAGGTNLYVRARSRSLAGKASAWSLTAGPVQAGKVGVADVGFDIAQLGGARMFYQPTQPDPVAVGLGPQDRAVWWDSDNDNRPWTWSGTAWTDRRIGNGAVMPDSLIASDLLVDGTITAPLFQAVMVLATVFVAGDQNGEHARMGPTGLRAYAPDPTDNVPNEIAEFGAQVAVRNAATGKVVASIDPEGDATLNTLRVTQRNPTFGGVSLDSTLWEYPRGIVGDASFSTVGTYWLEQHRTNGEIGLIELAFVAQPGRMYEMTSEPFELQAGTGDSGYVRIRYTTNNTAPTVTSPLLRELVISPIRNGFSGSRPVSAFFPGPALGAAAQTYRLLVTYGVANGSTLITAGATGAFRFFVRDIGPQRANIGQRSTGGGTTSTGTTTPPPTTARTTRTEAWLATWSRAWRQNGSWRGDVGTAMVQGYGDSFNGINGGAWGWPDLVGVLSGADIHKVEFYLYCEHAWFGTGVTCLIGGHGQLNLPEAWPGVGPTSSHHFGRPEGRWLDVTTWAPEIKSGQWRGCTLYINSTDPAFYGRFSGVKTNNTPTIRITYTK